MPVGLFGIILVGTIGATTGAAESSIPSIILVGLGLAFLEVIFAADNVILVAAECEEVVKKYRRRAMYWALIQGGFLRLIMLAGASWLHKFEEPFWSTEFPFPISVSPVGVVMLIGSIFLAYMTFKHFWEGFEHVVFRRVMEKVGLTKSADQIDLGTTTNWIWTGIKLLPLNIVFSIDSVLTAVTMTDNYSSMVIAVVIQVIVMLAAAEVISRYFAERPILKLSALGFVGLVAAFLAAESVGYAIPKSMLWAMGVFGIVLGYYFQLRHDRGADHLAELLNKRTRAGVSEGLLPKPVNDPLANVAERS